MKAARQSLSVAHVGRSDGPVFDGVSKTLRAQTKALLERDVAVEIWEFDVGANAITTSESKEGITVYNLPRYRNPVLAALDAPPPTKNWIKDRLQTLDFLHFHSVFTGHNNYVARLARRYAVTPHGGWSKQVISGRRATLKALWIRLFEKDLWTKAKFVQAVSPLESDELRALKGMALVEYIPNGIQAPDPIPTWGSPQVDNWLFLGRIAIEQKGLDLIVRAYASARRRGNRLPQLSIAGPDFRDGITKLKQLINELTLADHVEVLGPVSEDVKGRLFSNASVFIHTSRWEGMPMSILEALSYGVPCLVTPETGLADWVVQKRCGWSTETDVSAIAEALTQLAACPRQVANCSVNARSAVVEEFSWHKAAEKLEICYRR